jgi:hypothetical protein
MASIRNARSTAFSCGNGIGISEGRHLKKEVAEAGLEPAAFGL